MGHIPLRTCVICRQTLPKAELTRHTLSTAGTLTPDERQILPGRGYYHCATPSCVERFDRFAPRQRKPKGGLDG